MNYPHFTIEERCCLGLPSDDSLNRLAEFFWGETRRTLVRQSNRSRYRRKE